MEEKKKDFEDFWNLYPRKVGKLDAMKAWSQMARRFDPASIVSGAARFASVCADKDRQFIPYPATWLRAGRWMDEDESSLIPQRWLEEQSRARN